MGAFPAFWEPTLRVNKYIFNKSGSESACGSHHCAQKILQVPNDGFFLETGHIPLMSQEVSQG